MERYWPWCQISQSISPNQFILLYFFLKSNPWSSIHWGIVNRTEEVWRRVRSEWRGSWPGTRRPGPECRNVALVLSLSLSLSLVHSFNFAALSRRPRVPMNERPRGGRSQVFLDFFFYILFHFILFDLPRFFPPPPPLLLFPVLFFSSLWER